MTKLHPALQMWWGQTEHWEFIKHPLAFSVPYHDVDFMNEQMNQYYQHKREASRKAKHTRNWPKYIFLRERPYRINAFITASKYLDEEEYWEILGSIYIDTENLWQNLSFWQKFLFTKTKGSSQQMMDKEELEEFEKLPDMITIYRGYQQLSSKMSLSWTLDQKRAKWFALRLSRNKRGFVVSGKIRKENVIAYFSRRTEAEIVCNPKDIFDTKVKRVYAKTK